MEVSLAFLADHAEFVNGKLNSRGIFDQVYSPVFPLAGYELCVVLNLVARPSEFDSRQAIRLQLINSDGIVGRDINGEVNITRDLGGYPLEIPSILPLSGLTFPEPGEYHFMVSIEGEPKKRIPIYVRLKQDLIGDYQGD
jgi:hypothetical protein